MPSKESYGSLYRGSSDNSARSARSSDQLTTSPRSIIQRKPPKKTSSDYGGLLQQIPSSRFPRVVSETFPLALPERAPSSGSRPPPARRRGYRAAESGRGDVLPSHNSASNRDRTNSLSNLIASPFQKSVDPHHVEPRSLRSRKRAVLSDDEGNGGRVPYPNYQRHSWPERDDLPHKGERTRARSFYSFPAENRWWMQMKSTQNVMVFLLFCVACFVAGSYQKVHAASSQLQTVKHEESLLMVHLHKIEEQLIELHHNFRRVSDRSEGAVASPGGGGQRLSVDADLLDVQMRKLREMEAELDHEVRTLQNKLSDTAKRSIVRSFGEGAVQVDLDIGPGNGRDKSFTSTTISIRLWYDTPHTAWTFLQQIQNGSWNGAKFSVYQGRALMAQTDSGVDLEPRIDFIEQSQRGHDRYTVGLTDNGIILNLQDNREHFRREASVGVITAGFDTLRDLVAQVEASHSATAVIKKASVSHATKE